MDPDNSPVHAVLNLPEILESILLHVPLRDLLLGQRISRSFRDTVQGSIRLRRRLFLEPVWQLKGHFYDAYASHNCPGPRPANNTLLLRAFPGCYPTINVTVMFAPDVAGQSPSPTATSDHPESTSATNEIWSWDLAIAFPAEGSPARAPATDRPEASWRKMFLSQPPCKTLYLVRRWHRCGKPALVREGGITMGDFVDEIAEAAALTDVDATEYKWHKSYISSDRDWHFEGNVQCSSYTWAQT